jgi:hypothetical protein
LHNTQCNDSRDTVHAWWEGKGFPGAAAALERGVMVVKKIHVESYAKTNSTELARGRLWPTQYCLYLRRKYCRTDILSISELKKMSKWRQKHEWLCRCQLAVGIWSPPFGIAIALMEFRMSDVKMSGRCRAPITHECLESVIGIKVSRAKKRMRSAFLQ